MFPNTALAEINLPTKDANPLADTIKRLWDILSTQSTILDRRLPEFRIGPWIVFHIIINHSITWQGVQCDLSSLAIKPSFHKSDLTHTANAAQEACSESINQSSSRNRATLIPWILQYFSSVSRHFVKIKGVEANPKGNTVNTKYVNWVTPENFHAKPKKVWWSGQISIW